MIDEVLDQIYRIEVPLPGNPLRVLNSYLIRGKERHLLVDTGFNQPECQEVLFSALDDLGIAQGTVDVFGTHNHSDHIGLAPAVAGKEGKIYIGDQDSTWISSQACQDYWTQMDVRFGQEGFSGEEVDQLIRLNPARNLGPPLDLPNYTLVQGGKTFHIGNHELEVVEAPGHTPGLLCLWMPKEQVMFTTDHILFDITPNITMWPNMEDALGSYLDSLRAFQNYPVRLALPGHRETGDYFQRIEQLLAHHDRRIRETERVVHARPGMMAYQVAGYMTWKIQADSWEEFPIIQKWFAVGECISHLDYLRKRGRVRRVEEDGVHRYYPLGERQES